MFKKVAALFICFFHLFSTLNISFAQPVGSSVQVAGPAQDVDACPVPTAGPTQISGNITQNTAWNASQSPFIITGDVAVASGSRLTIMPCVQVRFDGHYKFVVNGSLIIQGARNREVVFTSNKTSPARGDWQYIQLSGANTLGHMTIEFADIGLNITSGNTTANNLRLNSNFTGIKAAGQANVNVADSKIIDNDVGIDLATLAASVSVHLSEIKGSATAALRVSGSGAPHVFDFENNWWGTTALSGIQSVIVDQGDNPALAQIDFLPFLDAPPPGGQPVEPNVAPVLNLVGNQQFDLGATLHLNLAASDLNNNDVLMFLAAPLPLPNGASLNSMTGEFEFTPSENEVGQHQITFMVSDGSLADEEAVTIQVNGSTGGSTKLTGQVMDATEAALGNTVAVINSKISFLSDPNNFVLTDANGNFTLDNAVFGQQVLDVDNTNASSIISGAAYASFREEIHVNQGVENFLPHPVYLPQNALTMDADFSNPNIPHSPHNPALNITLDVAANNAKVGCPSNCQDFTGMMSISEVPQGFGPAPMPEHLEPGLLITIQPVGVSYAAPAPITMPNTDNYPVGTQAELWSLDAGTGQFVVVGTLEVKPNGMMETISGGIRNNDWHLAIAASVDAAANVLAGLNMDHAKCTNCAVGSETAVSSGNLMEEHELTSYRSFGQSRALKFIYNSTAADPQPIISTSATIPVLSAVPNSISTELTIGGILQGTPIYNSTAGLNENQDEAIHLSHQFDASMMPTGRYPYLWKIKNNFDESGVSTILLNYMLINNQKNSPYGSGWNIANWQNLNIISPFEIVLSSGDGSIMYFEATTPATGEFVFYSTLATSKSPTDIISEDINNDGLLDLGVPASNIFSSDSRVNIYINNGNGSFVHSAYPIAGAPYSLSFADFNNDTFLDFIGVNTGSDGIFRRFGDGMGGFGGTTSYFPTFNWPISTAVGDFDMDGNQDVAVAHRYSSTNIQIFYGDGMGGYPSTMTYSFGGESRHVLSHDFNKDTFLDLVVSVDVLQKVFVLLNDGTGNFLTPVGYDTAGIPIQAIVADFNEDGLDDIAAATTSGNLTFLYGDNLGNFPMFFDFDTVSNNFTGITTNDFNLDGRPDLATTNGLGSQVFVSLNLGFGIFDSGSVYSTGASTVPSGLTSGEFNGDSALDIATSNSNNNSLTILAGIPTAPTGSIAYISPPGDYSTLIKNVDDTYTRTMKDGTQIHFDTQGRQTSVVDTNGNITAYAYNGVTGLLETVTDPAGLVTTFNYTNGKLTSIQDPASRITQFIIDANGDLIEIRDPDNTVRSFTYDNRHRLQTQTNKRDFTTSYDYGFHGRNIQANRPDGTTRKITPAQTVGLADLASGVGTQQNPNPVTRPEDVVGTYKDGFDRETTFGMDGFGAATKVTDALNRETITERDEDSNPTKITLPNLSVIDMSYDDKGNLLSVLENAIAATTVFTYEPNFNLVSSIQDPESNLTSIQYDIFGNPEFITDDVGTQTKLEYTDANCPGLATKITSALGLPEEAVTQFTYYPADCNLHKVIDPLLRETVFTYEANGTGNVKTVTDGEGKVTAFFYDTLNRIEEVKDADLKSTFYDYDDEGNLETVTDAKTNTTAFTYDEMNRLETVTDPLLKSETYTYDANGNLDTILDRKSQLIDFDYDFVNRLVKKALPGPLTTDYGYDVLDNLDTVTDPDSLLDFDYDAAGRLIRAKTAGSLLQPDVTLEYVYDKVGNRDLMREKIGAGAFVTTDYVFDNLNRLTSIQNPASSIVSFQYDALSRREKLTYPNNTTVDYVYDVTSQLKQLTHALSSTPFADFNYTLYDGVGNREQVNVVRPPAVTGVTAQLDYIYDSLYRLTDGTKVTSAVPFDEDYQYDPVGNRLKKAGQITDSTFDDANRLLNDTVYTYTYDDNGNMITKTEIAQPTNVTTYTYDAENQLIKIDLPNGDQWDYAYDGLGRRIAKTLNAVQTVSYVYDNEDILFEFDSSNNLVARYTHGVGIDEPLIMERDLDLSGTFEATEAFFYHADGLSSIVEITDNLGTIVNSYVYDGFGNIVQQNGSLQNPYTYTGREFDSESGLYFYRARYYDPTTGRFITEDPIGLAGSLNLYVYVDNNAINFIDPIGLLKFKLKDATVGAFGGGTAGFLRGVFVSGLPGGLLGLGVGIASGFVLGGFSEDVINSTSKICKINTASSANQDLFSRALNRGIQKGTLGALATGIAVGKITKRSDAAVFGGVVGGFFGFTSGVFEELANAGFKSE